MPKERAEALSLEVLSIAAALWNTATKSYEWDAGSAFLIRMAERERGLQHWVDPARDILQVNRLIEAPPAELIERHRAASAESLPEIQREIAAWVTQQIRALEALKEVPYPKLNDE